MNGFLIFFWDSRLTVTATENYLGLLEVGRNSKQIWHRNDLIVNKLDLNNQKIE